MALSSNMLKDLLPEFQRFLHERRFTSERYIPFYALRVNQFLSFANKEAEKEIEILTQRFLDYLRQKEDLSDELIQQADDALRLYLYHYEEGIKFRENLCRNLLSHQLQTF